MRIRDNLHFIHSQQFIGQSYSVEMFIDTAKNTDYLSRQLSFYVDSIVSQYVVRGIDEGKKDVEEIHFIMVTTKYIDLAEKVFPRIYRSIQRKIMYPVVLTINYNDEYYYVLFSNSHQGKKDSITVVDNCFSTGWLSYKDAESFFSIFDEYFKGNSISIPEFLLIIRRNILVYRSKGVSQYTVLEDVLPYEEAVCNNIMYMWFYYTVGTQDDDLIRLFWPSLSGVEIRALLNVINNEDKSALLEMLEDFSFDEMIDSWDEYISSYGFDFFQSFKESVEQEYSTEFSEKEIEECLIAINELLEPYIEKDEEGANDIIALALDVSDEEDEW